MSGLDVILSGTMVAQTVRMTIPYACAGLGGVLSERSGVVNIALEGILLSSALLLCDAQTTVCPRRTICQVLIYEREA